MSSRERVGVGSDGTSPSGWGEEERGEEEQEEEEEEEEEDTTGMKAADCYEGGGIELGGGRGREMLFVVALPAPLVLTHTSHHLSHSLAITPPTRAQVVSSRVPPAVVALPAPLALTHTLHHLSHTVSRKAL